MADGTVTIGQKGLTIGGGVGVTVLGFIIAALVRTPGPSDVGQVKATAARLEVQMSKVTTDVQGLRIQLTKADAERATLARDLERLRKAGGVCAPGR